MWGLVCIFSNIDTSCTSYRNKIFQYSLKGSSSLFPIGFKKQSETSLPLHNHHDRFQFAQIRKKIGI